MNLFVATISETNNIMLLYSCDETLWKIHRMKYMEISRNLDVDYIYIYTHYIDTNLYYYLTLCRLAPQCHAL